MIEMNVRSGCDIVLLLNNIRFRSLASSVERAIPLCNRRQRHTYSIVCRIGKLCEYSIHDPRHVAIFWLVKRFRFDEIEEK